MSSKKNNHIISQVVYHFKEERIMQFIVIYCVTMFELGPLCEDLLYLAETSIFHNR
jgi:hypothetical protein